MTIITKPLSEKKGDKLVVPLVDNDELATATAPSPDAEAQTRNIVLLTARARRVSTTTTLCLLLTALFIVSIGIVGGIVLYKQYIHGHMERFRGRTRIPFGSYHGDTDVNGPLANTWNFDKQVGDNGPLLRTWNFEKQIDGNGPYLQEEFEIDVEKGDYEKIDVPDFRDGRTGRFIHDFNTNTTGIMDLAGKRCFVMSLNRDTVLPPKSLRDLIHKMMKGYYKVDTNVVRETMYVVIPPITDLSTVGEYISKECEGQPVYKLEKYVGGVVKRSADLDEEPTFAQFSGKGITEIGIANFHELEAYEKSQI